MSRQPLQDQALAEGLGRVGSWTHDAARGAISRAFMFTDFTQAFAFMTQVALLAERRDHHPEWSNVYNRVRITWTTHDAKGLTASDIELAGLCDRAYAPRE